MPIFIYSHSGPGGSPRCDNGQGKEMQVIKTEKEVSLHCLQ